MYALLHIAARYSSGLITRARAHGAYYLFSLLDSGETIKG